MPLVATIHATEAGRHQGWLPGPMNRTIHSRRVVADARGRRVVTCSGYMRWEVTRLFELPAAKVDVVPNGVDAARWQVGPARVAAARRPVRRRTGRWSAYAGRLVYEKGVQDLLAAVPRLRRRHPGLRVVIAGTGPAAASCGSGRAALRLGRAVGFAGFVADADLAGAGRGDRRAVVPSLYEPFGMVALEAAAAGAPLAVAADRRAGGDRRGRADRGAFPPGDPAALADAVGRLLGRPGARPAAGRRRAGRSWSAEHGWARVAERTVAAYERAVGETPGPPALAVVPAGEPAGVPVVRDGNLLTGRPS